MLMNPRLCDAKEGVLFEEFEGCGESILMDLETY